MSARLRRYYERGQRSDKVNDSRAEDFSTNSKAAALAATVKEQLASLAALDVERASSMGKRQQGTAGRQSVRENLRTLVKAVADTADHISLAHPDTKGMFRLLRTKQTDQTLIATARSFADRAAPFVGLFVEYNLSATFINDLRSMADTLESYISLQNEGVGARINANASAEEHLKRLNEALEGLNIVYHNKYHGNDSVLAEWKSAYHLEAAPGTKSKAKSKKKKTPPSGDAPPDASEPPTLPTHN